MQHFKPGQEIRARVVGFLPGRRVVLDIDGEMMLASSHVPLVRGMMVRAIVERPGGTVRLRLHEESSQPVNGAELETLVRDTALMLGMSDEPELFRSVCQGLQEAVPDLRQGAVAWSEIQLRVQEILEARARGLPATRRCWGALRMGSGARLGTALARLVEALDEAALHSRGDRRRQFSYHSVRLKSFFLDLQAGTIASLLPQAMRQCGYLPYANLSRTDPLPTGNLPSVIASTDIRYQKNTSANTRLDGENAYAGSVDLRQALLNLTAVLMRFQEEPVGRKTMDNRRALERSSLWCVQAVEIVEALQAQNVPGGSDRPWSASLQIPVRDNQVHGTLFAILGGQQSSLWLEMQGRSPMSARLRSQDAGYKVDLYLPTGTNRSALQTSWCSELKVDLTVHEENTTSNFANVDLTI